MAILIDSYAASNYDYDGSTSGNSRGQTFMSPSYEVQLTAVRFYLNRSSSLYAGSARAKLFAMTGVFGASGVPTGAALAVSSEVARNALPVETSAWVQFDFPAPYTLQPNTPYCIALDADAVTSSFRVGIDASSPSHPGNYFDNTGSSWAANTGRDLIFEVYGSSSSGGTVVEGAASLTGSGSVFVSGVRGVHGAAELAGAGAVAASGVRVVSAAAVLTGTGTLLATTPATVYGAAKLTGAGQITLTSNNMIIVRRKGASQGAIRIMTPDFEPRGEIAVYNSLQLTHRHFGVGEFELHVHPNIANSSQLEPDNILFMIDNPYQGWIIESVNRKRGSDALVITGYSLKGLAKRRISVPPLVGSNFGWDRIINDAETVFKHYAAANMTAPAQPGRLMPRVALAANLHRGLPSLAWQTRFEALDEVFRQIGEYADMGWDILPDFTNKLFVFDVVPGRELQEGNPGNTRVTISVEMGVATVTEYSKNQTGWKNVAYTGGAGEDEGRLIQAVGDASGLQRREMWVDAGSIDNAPELIAMGHRKLAESSIKESISAVMLDSGAFRYGRDWNLGDKVTVRSGDRQMDARFTEVREVLEQGRPRQITAVFGSAPITVTDVIRSTRNSVVR